MSARLFNLYINVSNSVNSVVIQKNILCRKYSLVGMYISAREYNFYCQEPFLYCFCCPNPCMFFSIVQNHLFSFSMVSACSDFCFAVFLLPFRITTRLNGNRFCHAVPACYVMIISDAIVNVASILNLLLIALDR